MHDELCQAEMSSELDKSRASTKSHRPASDQIRELHVRNEHSLSFFSGIDFVPAQAGAACCRQGSCARLGPTSCTGCRPSATPAAMTRRRPP